MKVESSGFAGNLNSYPPFLLIPASGLCCVNIVYGLNEGLLFLKFDYGTGLIFDFDKL